VTLFAKAYVNRTWLTKGLSLLVYEIVDVYVSNVASAMQITRG